MGRRVIAPMVISAVVILFAVGFSYFFAFSHMRSGAAHTTLSIASFAPLVALFIVFPVFLLERSKASQFGIEMNCLVLGRKRFPLEGLTEASRDPHIMRWAVRVVGNGGLGSIRGRFWSKRMGTFYAFMTGTENAVVLRWPDKVVAVSPADPEFFIYSAKLAAGLK